MQLLWWFSYAILDIDFSCILNTAPLGVMIVDDSIHFLTSEISPSLFLRRKIL